MEAHKIYVELTKYGARGPLFDAYYEGQKIVSGKINASHDAARHLLGLGCKGRMEIYDKETSRCKGWFDIEKAAQFTTSESADRTVHLTKWKPYDVKHK